ncbi:MAG: aminoacyl-tRNA hydrolase [Candidatus Magasanikbacteria bacterium]|jgi:PTH1 family peptidyl-tRNA hydrolase
MKLLIGLGNPGKEYEKTRHNAGFLALDTLAKNLELKFKLDKKMKAEVAKNAEIILAKPQTFMNESGVAVRALMDFYKLKPNDIVVIHDDKDIPLGEWRDQTDRSAAGHNGIKSIIEHLGTQNFRRLRIGIATPEMARFDDKADFVLGKFSKDELKIVEGVIRDIIERII